MFGSKFKGQARKYRDENDNGGTGGVSIQDALNSPAGVAALEAALQARTAKEVEIQLAAKVAEEVAGLKKKNSDLIATEKKLKEQLANVQVGDVTQIKKLQAEIQASEEKRLLAEGKVEEVAAARAEAAARDANAALAARDAKLSEYEKSVKEKDERLAKLVIDGQIREAYITLDFEPAALDDVIRSGRDVFQMNDNGEAEPRDSKGNLIFGKDGKTPISASEWLEAQAEKKTYLRRASSGAGAGANRDAKSSKGFDSSKATSTQKIAEGLRQLQEGK